MQRPRNPCPNCDSEQPFPLRQRPPRVSVLTPDEIDKEVIEVYIACTVCPFFQSVRLSTRRWEELRQMEARLDAWGKRQERRSGQRSAQCIRQLGEVREAMRIEEAKLPNDSQ